MTAHARSVIIVRNYQVLIDTIRIGVFSVGRSVMTLVDAYLSDRGWTGRWRPEFTVLGIVALANVAASLVFMIDWID
jgi:hypothetical protein